MSDLMQVTKHPLTVRELKELLSTYDENKPVTVKLSSPHVKTGQEYYLPKESIVEGAKEVVLHMEGLNWFADADEEGNRKLIRDWANRP
jgi:hypothetical protein